MELHLTSRFIHKGDTRQKYKINRANGSADLMLSFIEWGSVGTNVQQTSTAVVFLPYTYFLEATGWTSLKCMHVPYTNIGQGNTYLDVNFNEDGTISLDTGTGYWFIVSIYEIY